MELQNDISGWTNYDLTIFSHNLYFKIPPRPPRNLIDWRASLPRFFSGTAASFVSKRALKCAMKKPSWSWSWGGVTLAFNGYDIDNYIVEESPVTFLDFILALRKFGSKIPGLAFTDSQRVGERWFWSDLVLVFFCWFGGVVMSCWCDGVFLVSWWFCNVVMFCFRGGDFVVWWCWLAVLVSLCGGGVVVILWGGVL